MKTALALVGFAALGLAVDLFVIFAWSIVK